MIYLSYIGIIAILAGLGWLGYWLVSQVKWRNPLKRYIRKEVITYLKHLQND